MFFFCIYGALAFAIQAHTDYLDDKAFSVCFDCLVITGYIIILVALIIDLWR